MRERWVFAVMLCVGCGSSDTGTTGQQQQTSGCAAGAADCLGGTAGTAGFTATPARMDANLYREFPEQGTAPLATVPVGSDGSWAFPALATWGHYYVQIAADFGQPQAVGAVVGPLSVPATGAPLAVNVKPVQLTVVEQALAGAALQLQSATAYVFDPGSGATVQGATVTITVGGSPVAMTAGTSAGSYSASFASAPPAAQPSYTITTALPGASPTSWQLQSASPTFTPTLTAPANGATVPKSQPLAVSWPAQPGADEEVVELFTQQQNAWQLAWSSPRPDDADVTQETVPATYVTAGSPLLVDVLFAVGSCPATADGCVVSGEIAAAQITAQ